MILVTGAGGFIGSNTVRAFGNAGHDVVGCDRLRHGGKWRNLAGLRVYDLIVPDSLEDWLHRNAKDVRLVVHLGAVSATTETDVDRIVRDNIRLTLDLWGWCSRLQVPFIYASSAATYGDGAHGFADNQSLAALSQLRPLNAYGWSKQFIDCRIMADVTAGRCIPPQWAGLKFFNVYGPGEDHKGEMRSVINKLIPVVRSGGTVSLFKSYREDYVDGGQKRDFIYVDDVVSIVAWIAARPAVSGLFNVGSGRARTWTDVAHAVMRCFGSQRDIAYIDMPDHIRKQYQYFTEAPICKLRGVGWDGPLLSLEQGVEKYVNSMAKSDGGVAACVSP